MRWPRCAANNRLGERRGEPGAAVVDFVVVAMVVVPLALALIQLALVLYVRNTAAAAASEGARYAAMVGHSRHDGEIRTRAAMVGLTGRYAGRVRAAGTTIEGAAAVEVQVTVRVPALGLGGPALSFTVSGHAVEEPR